MAETADKIAGKVILVAEIEAKPDKVEELHHLLLDIKQHATSETSEPDCLTYRVSKYNTKFVVFEEYRNQGAIKHHFDSHVFQTLGKKLPDIVAAPPKLTYYEEI
ncbi:hypothetical protein AURDEDRAFT_155647 [Auricularia subglabra TFB-10046 SS5]|nr:hypothetical protein AURDEDRAFT_155647 [Auricularia subglabra TFB-10046 SS5]